MKKCGKYCEISQESLLSGRLPKGGGRGRVGSVKSRKEKQRQESLLSLMAGATCESRLSSRL